MKSVFAVIFMLWSSAALYAAEKGSITGIVVNELGTLVPGAKVHVREMHNAYLKAIEYFETDQDGKFRISRLPFGEYRVYAKKEEENYADTGWEFYGNHQSVVTVLSEKEPNGYVIVKLPPRAGILKASVVDATTLVSMRSAVLNFERVGDSKSFLSLSANTIFPTFVPSDGAVRLEITAPGYLPWRYPGELHLKPNEIMQLDVRLQRGPNAGAASNPPQH